MARPPVEAAPAQRPAVPAGSQVIQPLLDRDQFRAQGGRSSGLWNPLGAAWRLAQPQQLTDIDNLVHQFHQHAADDTDQASVHTRLALLDRIEHHAFDWFDRNRDTAPSHATHRSLRALLDSVQADHEALIGATDAHNHALWTPDRGARGCTIGSSSTPTGTGCGAVTARSASTTLRSRTRMLPRPASATARCRPSPG